MTCSAQEPCPVYLDISHVYATGQKLLAAGNIHSAETTLYSILLESPDGGATWREPVERVRGGELDDIQFSGDTGWISGQRVTPLPGDPFFLITRDGGNTWHKAQILSEGSPGFIQKFWFDSPQSGFFLLDRGASGDEQMRYSRYETSTGGDAWTLTESANQPLAAGPKFVPEPMLRVRAERRALVLERRSAGNWVAAATFPLQLAVCTGAPETETLAPTAQTAEKPGEKPKDYVQELRVGPAPPVKKKP